jgi:hypothetical protein
MIDEGISQTIRNQKVDEIPQLFAYAQLMMSIGMTDGRYGTTKTPRKFWAQWREEEFGEDKFLALKNKALATDPRAALMKDRLAEVRDHFDHLWGGEQAVTGQDRLLVSLCPVRPQGWQNRGTAPAVLRHPLFATPDRDYSARWWPRGRGDLAHNGFGQELHDGDALQGLVDR